MSVLLEPITLTKSYDRVSVLCNPDPREGTVSSCSSAAYAGSYSSTHVCHIYMTSLYYMIFYSWFTLIAKFVFPPYSLFL